MTEIKFHLGDRVICTGVSYDGNSSIKAGMTGTVCNTGYDVRRPGICFDKRIGSGHGCDGGCDVGYGWYVDQEELALIEDNEIESDDLDFSNFMHGLPIYLKKIK